MGTESVPVSFRSPASFRPHAPSDLLPLTDRDIEARAIESLLPATPPPLVEVSGRVGVGKTALVQRLDGTLYIDAVGLNFHALLQRLYERVCASEVAYVPSVDRLRALFSHWRMPIVIDGFEGNIREWYTILDVLKSVTVVYTTREPLHLHPSVMELRLAGLRPNGARELFERSFGASIVDDGDAMEFVNVVLEGNPLLIGHAGALARAGALSTLHAPEPLAALTFNSMTISEQQVFGTIAGFEATRPDRAMVEAVSATARANGVIDALIARHIVQTDGECVWISPLMRPILSAIPSLVRYDVVFEYIDMLLSQPKLPPSVTDNPKPIILMLRYVATKGRYEQVVRNARTLVNALLLAGRLEEAKETCELLRSVVNETCDKHLQAWIQHQTGTLSALSGDHESAITWLESAEALRARMGDRTMRAYSHKNVALLRGRASRKGKKAGIARDITVLSWAIGLVVLGAVEHVVGWPPSMMYKAPPHAPARAHAHRQAALTATPRSAVVAPVVHTQVSQDWQTPQLEHPSPPRHQPTPHPAVKAFTGVPRIARFTSSAKSVVAGGFTALCFRLAGATSAFLQPIGKVSAAHPACVRDAPHANTYYTLYAYNQNGMSSASVYVDVLPVETSSKHMMQARNEPGETRVP
jgi:hypothetical protein